LGTVVKSAVGSCLLSSSEEIGFQLFWWREGNDEVDFILKKGGKLVAIKVKSGYESKPGGMETFRTKFYRDKLILDGNPGLFWQDFLKLDLNQLF